MDGIDLTANEMRLEVSADGNVSQITCDSVPPGARRASQKLRTLRIEPYQGQKVEWVGRIVKRCGNCITFKTESFRLIP